MRTTLALAAALLVSAVAVCAFLPDRAEAGPVYVATLVSNDAGSSQTVQIKAKQCYCVQAPSSRTCMSLQTWDAGSLAATCSMTGVSDFHLPSGQPGVANDVDEKAYCFDSAGRTAVVAIQFDAGTVNLNLYSLEQNPSSPNYGCDVVPRWSP